MRVRDFYRSLLGGAALVTPLAMGAVQARAQTPGAPRATARYAIPAQPLAGALQAFGTQSGSTIMADALLTRGKSSRGYVGTGDPVTALRQVLRGTGLSYRHQGSVFVVVATTVTASVGQAIVPPAANAPQTAPVAETRGEEIIVTAQRREESLQDVPIAVTAVTGRGLNDRKIETGAELLRAVPNVNFTKTNFSGFNFTIRGIGTKAISASSDPAVAVSFNSTPLIRSRLFEQEFFDISRVEILRGPQGTLYGRNATGGVVNVLPTLPGKDWEGMAWVEAGNFSSMRTSGMLNVPLTDTLAVRVAGAYTYRDGFEYNSFTDKRVNGRDLYSTRVSARWAPSSDFSANVIWQHFNENDDRSRSGKALCTRDDGPAAIGGVAITDELLRAKFSQGCKPGSLYDDAAYQAPNGLSLPNVNIGLQTGYFYIDRDGGFQSFNGLLPADPFAGIKQSRNLREIATTFDPIFRAKNDVFQLNLEAGLGDTLRLFSQTLYTRDRYYSSQDYNRFVSNPIFVDTADPQFVPTDPGPTPGGVFTDPQFGPSSRLLSIDVSRSRSRQYSQEFRLQSDFAGPLDFSLGANYLDFRSQDDYFVFNNTFTYIARYFYNYDSDGAFPLDGPGRIGTRPCQPTGPSDAAADCVYIDPNPLNAINEQGRNYFLSRNIVETQSKAVFGELYYNVTDNFKLTGGLRYTDDRKRATPVPSQLLLGIGPLIGVVTGGLTAIGNPTDPDIEQRWRRFSGRVVADWRPNLSFTDDTLIYGSFAHGYKGGGTNPPRVAINPAVVQFVPLPTTFRPEYVNAFEIGTKNSFGNGRFSLNLTGFYYDYTNYQVSQIVDRISLNENLDARSMGLELEAAWRPTRRFQFDTNIGYLKTRIGKQARSIDVMDRTQGDPDWVVVRPAVQVPSNCVAPLDLVRTVLSAQGFRNGTFVGDPSIKALALESLCNGSARGGVWSEALTSGLQTPPRRWDRIFGTRQYNALVDAPNNGRGFFADLDGNELPNSPNLTINVGAQYTLPLGDWAITLRGDYYRQSASFARIYNTRYDRLRAWENLNLTATIARPADNLSLQFYVKNVFNKAPITDVFTNSDDTGLTGNVFTLDPRIFAVRLTKAF